MMTIPPRRHSDDPIPAEYDNDAKAICAYLDGWNNCRTEMLTSTEGRDPIIHAVASLAAVISLLERTEHAKNAAASDKMFSQMLQDYRTALENARAALASAPVAGQAYQGENVAERLDSMADGLPPGSQAQSDLYAAATIWRKHISHHAAPQASEEGYVLAPDRADKGNVGRGVELRNARQGQRCAPSYL